MTTPVVSNLKKYIEHYPSHQEGKEALLRLLGRLAICAHFSPQKESKEHSFMMEELLCLFDEVAGAKEVEE